jgi:hypothetical protein
LWRYTRYALNFMDQIPFGDMVPSHNLLTGESTYDNSKPKISGVVLAKAGEVYAIQLPNASSTGTLNLSGASGSFTKRWYNPRTGGFEGSMTTIAGGGNVALGAPPSSPGEDWVVLIEKITDDDGTTSGGVFQEVGGLVVMEVESTPVVSPWVEETAMAGFTGSSHYRMTIDDFDPSTPSGELSYRINISNPGNYRLRIRGWKPDVGDIGAHNDSWVKLVGHPGDEGIYNKLFMGGAAGEWNWDTTYDVNHTLYKPRYSLSAGEHELRIAGRSRGYVIDRIVLYREDLVTTGQASDINNPQSP